MNCPFAWGQSPNFPEARPIGCNERCTLWNVKTDMCLLRELLIKKIGEVDERD